MTEEPEKTFKPVGAIAFFVALLILSAIIWFGIYFFIDNTLKICKI